MDVNRSIRCGGVGAQEVVADLIEADLLEIQPGERLWKLYCFWDAGHPTRLRHRIYAKQKVDGRLALVTFAAHDPAREDEDTPAPHNGTRVQPSVTVRSAVARVPDLSPVDLERLTAAVRAQSTTSQCEELDLTEFASLADQLAWLQEQA